MASDPVSTPVTLDGSETRSLSPRLNKEFVLAKCRYFVNVQLWPLHHELDPEGWLSNFTDAEMDHAIHLLNAFMYFRRPLVEQLFRAAVQDLSNLVRHPNEPFRRSQAAWRNYMNAAIFTRVTGEIPSDTDSGFIFSRMARQVLGISEESVIAPVETLRILQAGGARTVIFLDDFVGSGRQFIRTWKREETLPSGTHVSFERIASFLRDADFTYCPLICTAYGLARIKTRCPPVTVNAAHVLPDEYGALHPTSIIWPDDLRATAKAFIDEASRRAGIPDSERYGFQDRALALAFEHSVPDATLPLLRWKTDSWKPLAKRK